jgi:hypothetical protein
MTVPAKIPEERHPTFGPRFLGSHTLASDRSAWFIFAEDALKESKPIHEMNVPKMCHVRLINKT